ncbi:adenylosuccinate lyase [Candidatus Avelusimicrobium luingense]|uniref:adenylosuccinate lyase n=1 Tax=Candidatus Avelusimicrobium luingense TaxID=3416211 RepID=UPI003D14DEA3
MDMTALCPLDGRYRGQLDSLRSQTGEAAFATYRVQTELTWLQILSGLKLPHFKALNASEKKLLSSLFPLSANDLSVLRAIEFEGYKNIPATRHDVKAVEYFLRLKLQNTVLKDRLNYLHFSLTSEDVNSVSYALLLANGVEKALLPAFEKLHRTLMQLSRKEAASVLLARTHGQPAVPTTFGKEIRVTADRLARQITQLKKQQISCKFGGAVGNFNAHTAAFPGVNWPRAAKQMIDTLNKGRKIKLVLTPVSTQVDPRDSYAELFDNLRRINVLLIDFCRDMWQYISAGLVHQQAVKGEVGSSTMPQKVNPIDFENAEGNLQLASALCDFFSNKLPISRLQRDLSDSTVLRNMAVAFGYICVAQNSLFRGLGKIAFNRAAALTEVKNHPEVLAEAFQTILRAANIQNPYEKLRDLTRGRTVTYDDFQRFIKELDVPQLIKKQLLALTPENYTGLAAQLARR